MPGKVKVKIISGKNLPVMDRSSDTTDAYVEIKLGNTTYKTDVCRRTLNPHWNTDWYRFEVDDSELQDEPLQIRLMDHDTYSANDSIGKVYLNLNPLLLPVAGQLAIGDNNPHHEISGWIPVFDTMHGIRGEVNVTVKVELFSDFNRFRQSSCGVHFFYSPTIPQGYQAKIINGFVEELIVDDDPEYQWIDKIRTPRASNEARQTLFFKLSGELQRKIGVKALSLGGNAVIGYKQCFDLEGESGIVARGIGTAVTLMKSLNIHHLVVEAKDENIENYLKFLGDGKSFSLCSTPLPHKFHFPFTLLNPQSLSHVLPIPQIPKLAKRQYASVDSNMMPSVSNPNLSDGQTNIKLLLNQEDKRGKSAMSRRFQKFKHSQKSLSNKMIALKAKINDSIGEESDDSQSATTDKRKFFKRTASDSSAMAEILARSVMRATTSLSSILEDNPTPPQSPNEDETMEKLEPIANLLTKSESEIGSLNEAASDAQSCSSTDSSSSSDYEFRDYNKANNDVETISNIITNVERLQRCLSREGLHKQYSLPAIPTKGFSLSSLDNLSQFESSDNLSQEDKCLNESLLSVTSSASNLSDYDELNRHPVLQERRSSDSYDSRTTRVNKYRKLKRFDEIDLDESTGPKSIATTETQASETALEATDVQEFKFPSDHQADQKNIAIKNDACTHSKNEVMETPSSDSKEKEFIFQPARTQRHLDHEPMQGEQNSIVNSALQTMLFERVNVMGAPPSDFEEKSCELSSDMRDLKHDSATRSRIEVEQEPKTIVNTALKTMLFERANIMGTPPSNSERKTFEFPSATQERHTRHEHAEQPLQIQAEPSTIRNSEIQTMIFERSDIIRTPQNILKTEKNQFEPPEEQHDHAIRHESLQRCKQVPHDTQTEPNTIVNSALQTMLFERANLMGTPPHVKEELWEFSSDRDNITEHNSIEDSEMVSHEIKSAPKLEKEKNESHVGNKGHNESFSRKLSRRFKSDFKCVELHEPEPKGIVKTALQTMLIERAELLGSETVSTENENQKAPTSEQHKDERELQKEKFKSQKDRDDHNESFTRKLTRKFKPDPKFVEHHEHEPKGMLNTALQTMLIERAEILGTDAGSSDNEIHKAATSQCESCKSEFQEEKSRKLCCNFKTNSKCVEHHEPEPKALVKTALQTMLIERADLLGAPDTTSVKSQVVLEPHDKILPLSNQETFEHKPKLFERSNILPSAISKSNDNLEFNSLEAIGADLETNLNDYSNTGSSPIQHSVEDINVIAPVQLENVTIKPNKMVKTAMQTMLLEKYNLLGTYTPPTSPTSKQTGTFTFDEVDSKRKTIPKSSSSASLGEHKRQYETVLGMPFASLSSLMLDYEKEIKMRRPSFLSETRLAPMIETLKGKAGARKKRFKFLQSKSSESGKHSGMFQKFRMGSKRSIPDDIHHRHEDKSLKDEETQTSNELLNSPNPFQKPESNLTSNNLPKTKITPPKPPSHKDLASGDFLAHSKTKSACITSHHSSPAQERQDQNGGERKDAHSPDPATRISHSPVKVNYMVPLHRRSSDSDLSITPKGNSLTGSDKSMGNAAAYFMRNNYIRRGQMNQEHLDMLEYPFLTMTKFPPRFIIQIGGSISARSVKLLERILNVDEPESRDIWWSEIRMEIRSHARSLNCNAVLGYTELTSICDDVCVLSACGTAAIIDFNSSAGDDDNFSNVQLIHKNVERDKHVNGHQKASHESPDHRVQSVYSCSVTHLPYDEKTVPLKSKVSKCPMCLKGKVPEVLIATIEPPESVPSMGKGCFIESHVSRPLKDLRGETIAKEISDGLPFLEYELHRLLVNKLKIKGMNAIFSLKIRITIGEKLLVGVATGTAIYLSCLPSPDLPVLVTDKVSDEKLVADLQEMLNQTVKKNKEIYQIKDDNQNQKCLSDEDSDEEQASLDISCGNKDCCILEMDDPEDAEVLRLLMQEKVPDGFHVVSTESVPGLEDLEIVKNLQMFTQIYRAKLVPPYNLQKHFVRILQSVYFKLRRMVPCALCDLQFRIDVPEPDEIQFCVIGMALGLGKKIKNTKAAIVPKKPEEDLIFKLDDDHLQDNLPTQISKSNPSSLKLRSHRSPSKYRPQSIKQRHIPYNERRHGVDITPLSYVPGGIIEQYLGNLNFFFIRETTSIREEGGLSGFIHSFITEVLAIVRSHVTALGGNALVAFFMTESVLNHNLHKNQGQCLINVGGDVVSVSYFKDDS